MTATITRDGVEFALVNSTNGIEVPVGKALISANLRETKNQTVSPETRYRNVVIPEFSLPDVPDRFRSVLLDKFYSLAKGYLESVMEETNRMAREIPVAAFTVESLLSFASREATSSRLTGETVGAWFDASATGNYIITKCGSDVAKVKKYRDLFVKTASPNHGINPNTCTVLLAMLQSEDSGSVVYESLAGKWQATINKSQQSEVDAL